MGIFNDIFGTPKPRVTEKEFKKVRTELALDGMNRRHRDKVESIFSGDMYEKSTTAHPKGIEKDEVEQRIKWMRQNMNKHGLTNQEINEVEASLKKRL
jgi:hypothetical protein